MDVPKFLFVKARKREKTRTVEERGSEKWTTGKSDKAMGVLQKLLELLKKGVSKSNGGILMDDKAPATHE
jgi:hypothetical protein